MSKALCLRHLFKWNVKSKTYIIHTVKIVIQRVSCAEVWVSSKKVSEIKNGLVVLVGFYKDDNIEKLLKASKKVSELRIFEDESKKMNLSVKDKQYEMLVVPNFTLASNINKGKRPSFDSCMEPEKAKAFFEKLCELLSSEGIVIRKGIFGSEMEVKLTNVGPVTFVLEF